MLEVRKKSCSPSLLKGLLRPCLRSHMSHMARTKLRKMQQEITRKEQAIGELHARVSGKELRLPKPKVGASS